MINCLTYFFLASTFWLSGPSRQDFSISISDSSRIGMVEDLIVIVESNLLNSIGQKAPPLEFFTISDQRSHSLSDFPGNVVMLNFWRTSCRPCILEMPDISLLQDDYHGAGLRVLFLTDQEYDIQNRFFEISRISGLKARVDSRKLLKPYQVAALPMLILIDREGIIRDGWFGAIGYDAMEKRVNALLPPDQKRSFSGVHRFLARLPMPPFYFYCAIGGILLIIIALISALIRKPGQ